ncbi:hypothetical protein NEFER03_0775 [Nematocida sp. LUAm3]|nr:hypothetical protein NEFER03_0775 [Nematocida sp. LUAm3]KAI5175234.1 hypothetical protein NEFER02_1195 [Nematocida sp. LUAm2]KAI5178094.1 hypothetical protein NEFER01_1272 [Nematocida sp. LUAm1]
MQLTYKAAEGFFLFTPMILTFIYKKQMERLTSPENVIYFRCAFVISVLIDLGISYLIKKQIAKRNIKTKIRFETDDYIAVSADKTVKTEEDAEDTTPEIEMTVSEYDNKVITTHMSKIISSALIYTAIHLIVKSPQPIMMLILNPIKNFFFCPIYIEYLRGKSLLRPFSRNIMFTIGETNEEQEGTEEAEQPSTQIPKESKNQKAKKEE